MIVPAWTISSCRPMVAKPSARLKVVTLPEPCPIGYAASDVPAVHPRSVVSTNPTSRYSVRPISLLTLTASLAGTTVRSSEPRPASRRITGATNSWNVKIAEVGKPGSTTTARPSGRGEADGLARLERHAMRDDAGIVKFGDNAIRHIARALAGSTRQQHDVGKSERILQPFAQSVDIVTRDAQPPRLAAQFTHGVGEHLPVGVVDFAWLHFFAGRDDLVAGRKNRDHRLSPDLRHSRRRSRRVRPYRGWSTVGRGEARSRPR